MRQLAPLFGISPATVCRVIQRLRPLLALEPTSQPAADAERLWIVDGTLVPVRGRVVAAFRRTYRLSANVQVTINADSRLVIASARLISGNMALRPQASTQAEPRSRLWSCGLTGEQSGEPAEAEGPRQATVSSSTQPQLNNHDALSREQGTGKMSPWQAAQARDRTNALQYLQDCR